MQHTDQPHQHRRTGRTGRSLMAAAALCATMAAGTAHATDVDASGTTAKPHCVNGDGSKDYIQGHTAKNSRWCIEPNVWKDHKADFKKFYPYGKDVIKTLQELFDFTPDGLPFTYQANEPNGWASTGSDFGLGDQVTGDAFWNDYTYQDAAGKTVHVPGFWGYLLSLHEAINVWTGEMTSNWPTDWWADHRSPFPNSMDYHIMKYIGEKNNDATLLAAADAQHRRFGIKGINEYDSEVAMFDSFYDRFGGFDAYSRAFSIIQGDDLEWSQVAPNPSPLLSEYVIAYLQLGFKTKTDLTKSDFVAAGVGTKDTTIPAYTVSPNNVKSIGDAHCSIAGARTDPNVSQNTINTALDRLRHGQFSQAFVTSRSCKQTPVDQAPAECGCNSSTLKWVALWTAIP